MSLFSLTLLILFVPAEQFLLNMDRFNELTIEESKPLQVVKGHEGRPIAEEASTNPKANFPSSPDQTANKVGLETPMEQTVPEISNNNPTETPDWVNDLELKYHKPEEIMYIPKEFKKTL